MNTIIKQVKIHLDLSFESLLELIDVCPDELWDKKQGGFVFWQQILHALTGSLFWTRLEKKDFGEPFGEREVFPELDREPKGKISKAEMKTLANDVKRQMETFIYGKEDEWLNEPNAIYDKISNVDILLGQIRHIQYHVGHCEAGLRERNQKTVEWKDYFG